MNKTQTKPFYKKDWFKILMIILLVIVFPISLILVIPGLLFYFIWNHKKYPRLSKVSIGLSTLMFILTVIGSIMVKQEENEILALINQGQFEEAQQYINESDQSHMKLMKELDKLNEEFIDDKIDELATLKITDVEKATTLKTYSDIPVLNQEIVDRIISKSDQVEIRIAEIEKEKLANEQQELEDTIARIQSKIRQINNGRIPILDIPNTIQEFPDTPELSTYRNQLIQAARNHQIKTLPTLRKDYAERIGKELWENDYEIYTKGNGHSTIVFVHWSFASNSNIKTTHELFRDKISELRFDRAEYKWSEYGEYTFYNMESKADSYIEGIDSN